MLAPGDQAEPDKPNEAAGKRDENPTGLVDTVFHDDAS